MTVAIATAMAGKAVEVAGEPVRAAVAELVRRVRDRLRRAPGGRESTRPGNAEAESAAHENPGHEDPEGIAELQETIQRLIEQDPRFGAELRAIWSRAHQSITADDHGVVNVFNGQAGKVVQLRDVHGDLTIG